MNQTISDAATHTDPLPPPPRKKRWRTPVLMLLMFICGGIVGGGAMLKFIDARVQEAIHHPERMPARVASRLARRLDLSDKQQIEVEKILRRRQQELLAVRSEFQPRVETILDGIEVDVSAILDAGQKLQWQEDAKRFRARFTPTLPKMGEQGT